MHRVILKDVAAAAKLSVSCTARALKGRRDISTATCARVRKIAASLGYRPDPMLSSLAAYRRTRRPTAFQGTLAFLATIPSPKEFPPSRINHETGDLLRGACQRAESLGYRMEYFSIGSTAKSHERAWKIFRSRGIPGIVVRSFPLRMKDIRLPFEQFGCVNLFSEPHTETTSTVSSYHAQSMELVLQKLLERGYRHPALVLSKKLSELVQHGWQMAFSVYAAHFGQTSTFPYEDESLSGSALASWAKKNGVDSLIVCNSENLVFDLGLQSRRSSDKTGIVCMDLLDPNCGLAGIYQDRPRAGAVAVECLHNMLITAQLGIEKLHCSTMIPGVWQEGTSLPSR